MRIAIPLALLLSSGASGAELPKLDGRGECSKRVAHQVEQCLATEAKDKAFLAGASIDELLVKICSLNAEWKQAGYSAMRQCVEGEWREDRRRAIAEADFSPREVCTRRRLTGPRLSACLAGEIEASAHIQNSPALSHRQEDFSSCFERAKGAGGSSVLYLECMEARSEPASKRSR